MKQTNSNLLRLVEKALAQCGHHSAEISIKLSPSRQLANVRAGKKRFSVLLSERPEQEILNSTGFVLTEDAIDPLERAGFATFYSIAARWELSRLPKQYLALIPTNSVMSLVAVCGL